jgi:uncharacterized protein YukE
MPHEVAVDAAMLSAASHRLDQLFEEARAALGAADQAISDNAAAWAANSAAAFSRFTSYLDTRRAELQAELARMSDTLASNANDYRRSDQRAQAELDAVYPAAPLLRL